MTQEAQLLQMGRAMKIIENFALAFQDRQKLANMCARLLVTVHVMTKMLPISTDFNLHTSLTAALDLAAPMWLICQLINLWLFTNQWVTLSFVNTEV